MSSFILALKKIIFLVWWAAFMAYMVFIVTIFTAMLPNTIIRQQVDTELTKREQLEKKIDQQLDQQVHNREDITRLQSEQTEMEQRMQYEESLHLESRLASIETLMSLIVKALYGIVAGVVGLVAAEGLRYFGIGIHRHRRATD